MSALRPAQKGFQGIPAKAGVSRVARESGMRRANMALSAELGRPVRAASPRASARAREVASPNARFNRSYTVNAKTRSRREGRS